MRIADLKYGDTVRAECTAIGRYLGEGKVLYVSAMTNDLVEGGVARPIRTDNKYDLPLPSDEDMAEHTGKCKLCGK